MAEVKEFYLTPRIPQRLASMGKVRRGLWMTGWLLKSLFLKLTPLRRFVFLVALILLVSSPRLTTGAGHAGQCRRQHVRRVPAGLPAAARAERQAAGAPRTPRRAGRCSGR